MELSTYQNQSQVNTADNNFSKSLQLQPVQEVSQQTQPISFETKPAGAWARFWAAAIDSMVIFLPSFTLAFLYALVSGTDLNIGKLANSKIFGLIFIISSFLNYIYLTTAKGTTIGKDAYGLKVVKYERQDKLTYKESTIRELVRSGLNIVPFIGGLFNLINGLMIVFSKQKRGIHDKAARSQVLRFKKAWPMRKQIIFFGGYVLLILLMFLVRPQFFEYDSKQESTVISDFSGR